MNDAMKMTEKGSIVIKLNLVILLSLFHLSSAFAEADLNPAIFNTTSTASSESSSSTGSTAVKDTKASVPSSTINLGANQGQQSQNSGSGSNAGAGAALMAAGAAMMANPATMPAGAALMAMGALAMMQSGHDSGAAGSSGKTASASNTNTTTSKTNPVDATGSSAFVDAKLKEAQSTLASNGYKITEQGLTKPDGSFTPSSAFNSASSMSAAGIPQAAIDKAQQILSEYNKNGLNAATVASMQVGSPGGGMTEGDSHGSSETGFGKHNPFDVNAAQKAALVAGKTVMYAGEPIGVSGQNIFQMIHSCYQRKREGKHFIESEMDVSARSPASVKTIKRNK